METYCEKSASYFWYNTPSGPISIGVCDSGVSHVIFGKCELEGRCKASTLSNKTATELLEYFAGKRRMFDVALAPAGSNFQLRVWEELTHISYAQAMSATELATHLGLSNSARAVGVAIKKNPLEVLIPTHRIINAKGKATGADKLSQLHFALLEFERRNIASDNA